MSQKIARLPQAPENLREVGSTREDRTSTPPDTSARMATGTLRYPMGGIPDGNAAFRAYARFLGKLQRWTARSACPMPPFHRHIGGLGLPRKGGHPVSIYRAASKASGLT